MAIFLENFLFHNNIKIKIYLHILTKCMYNKPDYDLMVKN